MAEENDIMFLSLLSGIYSIIVRYRNRKFDNQTDIVKCLIPVISVGNISAGGTGKTPFVKMLTEELLKLGKRPVIIGRGYKKKKKGEAFVSDGTNIFLSPEEAGDEMYMLASLLDVPVIANEKKYLAARKAEQLVDADVIIVDDGFQHRKLFRDMDIVLVDRRSIDDPRLLPAGRLREPLESLKRAQIICLPEETDESVIEKYLDKKCLIIKTKIEYAETYSLSDDKKINRNEMMIAVAGIAQPERFINSMKLLKFKIKDKIIFNDHHDYTEEDIKKIISKSVVDGCRQIITTEKDAVKLKKYNKLFANSNINCYVLPINNIIIENKELFIRKIKNDV